MTELATPGAQTSAFDRDQYEAEELRLPRIDGYSPDAIRISLTGGMKLDRHDPDQVSMFRDAKLGARVRYVVEGTVIATPPRLMLNRDGELEAVSQERQVKVDRITIEP